MRALILPARLRPSALHPLRAIAAQALRRHLQRWPFLLAVCMVAWLPGLLWVEPTEGMTVMRVGRARVFEDSSMLALLFGTELSLWVGLLGFLVVRGQAEQDWRSGLGTLAAATPISNRHWTFGLWLAAIATVAILGMISLCSTAAIHAQHSIAAFEPWRFFMIGLGLMAPSILFVGGMATLAEHWRPLMGRRGDILFFVVWLTGAFAMDTFWRLPDARWNPLLLIDGPGHYSVLAHLSDALGTHEMTLGGRSSFDTSLSPVHLPEGAWWRELALSRTLACLLMIMWLLPAIRWCHRFSPDQLTSVVDGLPSSRDGVLGAIAKILRGASAWSWLQWPARRALVAAARSPGLPAQVLAQTCALLLRNPFVIALLPISGISGLLAPTDAPMYAQPVFLLCWSMAGIVISAIGSHEHQEGWSPLTQCVPGGAAHRFLRQWAAAALLGNLVCAGLFASHAWHAPIDALIEQIAMLAFAALAIVLGQLAKSPRPFLFIVLTTAVLLRSTGG